MCATPGYSTTTPARIFCSADPPRAAPAVSAALARPQPPRPFRARAAASVSSAPAGAAKAAAGHTWRSCAACRTGAGSTRQRRPGVTGVAGRVGGPTWSRRSGCAPPASCYPPRIWTAIPATTGCAIFARSAGGATCGTTGRTTWHSAGSPTVGAGLVATCSSVATRQMRVTQRGRERRRRNRNGTRCASASTRYGTGTPCWRRFAVAA